MCGYRTPKIKEGTIEWPIYKIKRRLMSKKIIRIKQNKSLQFETFNKNFRWACRWSKLLYAFRSNQHFSFVIVWDKNMVVERGISDVKALTSSIFHNPKHIYIYIYILSKNWNVSFIVTTLILSHISGHIIHPFSTFSLSLFLLISQLNVIYSFTFLLPFTFSSPRYYLS